VKGGNVAVNAALRSGALRKGNDWGQPPFVHIKAERLRWVCKAGRRHAARCGNVGVGGYSGIREESGTGRQNLVRPWKQF